MKIRLLSIISISLIGTFTACKKDNYDPPASLLQGRVVYQNQPIGVRSNGVQLELWQSGYQLFTKIPVYVTQEGSFSASLFDGDYKLTRLKGNGPWADNTDTINVQVRGNTTVEVPVQPYFIIKNETFQKSGTAVTASAKVDQVVAGKTVERVSLYIGNTQIVDANINAGAVDKTGTAVADLSQPFTFSFTPTAAMTAKGYVFGRIGVKTTGVSELAYSSVQKIQL